MSFVLYTMCSICTMEVMQHESTDSTEENMSFSRENTKICKMYIYWGPESIAVAPLFYNKCICSYIK